MSESLHRLPLALCWRAAKAVHAAENGLKVIDTLRPHSVNRIFRGWAPTTRGNRLLHLIDRYWKNVQFGAIALVGLVLALAMEPFPPLWPAAAFLLAAVFAYGLSNRSAHAASGARNADQRDDVDYCDHCVDPEQVEVLRRTPLRRLTAAQLGPLLFNAMSTWGDLAYFQHFLPRLLELTWTGAMEDWSYPSFLPNRLARCWTHGTAEQQAAIARFLAAWWSATISSWPSRCQPRDVLETIDRSGHPVAPYLAAWAADGSEAAARHLAAFVGDWQVSSQTADQFWIDVDRWLRSDAPLAMVAAAIDHASDPSVADELTDGADSLSICRSSR